MNEKSNLEVKQNSNNEIQILAFEKGLISFLKQHSLPSDKIFVEIPERIIVFKNLEDVLRNVELDEKQKSLYLSKFIAGIASGLFDVALNYLWNETILQIRKRIVQYDIDYFYDNAVTGDKRKRLKDENDLIKVDDYELIKGAKEIGLISEIGFKHLEYINYMRNWASAAHPNQVDITGLQIISWLETCIKEVILLPISKITVKIKHLLSNIKTTPISNTDAQEIAVFFTELTQEQINNFVSGLFGIYTKPETESQTRQNINLLLPLAWERVDEDTRNTFGLKYGNFVANSLQDEKKLSREFLQIVNAESYIPVDLRVVEIETAIENLVVSHNGHHNFYNEPSFANQLKRIIGETPKIPIALNKKYVYTLVNVFLSNGFGIAHSANTIYLELIKKFDSLQANIAVLSFNYLPIASKLQFTLCQTKFRELIDILKPIVTTPAIKDLIEKIEKYTGKLEHLKDDTTIKASINSLKVLLK
jgi:hypothetical protein